MVDGVGSEAQARQLAQKRREVEDTKNALEVEKARADRDRLKAAALAKEKTDKEVVAISKAGEQQLELVKKLNSERVKSVNENTQKQYLALSETVAGQVKQMEADAFKAIENHRLGTMEKVTSMSSKAEDPFYRLKSLNPVMSESDVEYLVKVALPEHEAQNLFVSGEGQNVKLSLARRFQEQARHGEEARTTKTSSFQTVVESLSIPGAFDPRGIKREYAEGVVTIRVPKAGLPAPEGEGAEAAPKKFSKS